MTSGAYTFRSDTQPRDGSEVSAGDEEHGNDELFIFHNINVWATVRT